MRKLLLTLCCCCFGITSALASMPTELSAVKGSADYGVRTVFWGFAWDGHGNTYRRYGYRGNSQGHRPHYYRHHGYGYRGHR